MEDHIIEMAGKVTWPGAFVLIVLVIAGAFVIVSMFGDWPRLITINKIYKARPDKEDDGD